MAKNTTLNIKIDSKLKDDVKEIYSRYGVSLNEAIKIFLHESRNVGGLPFEMRFSEIPNEETIEAIEEAERLINDINAKRYTSVEELFKDLKNIDEDETDE